MTIRAQYEADIAKGKILPDPAQARVVDALQHLSHTLIKTHRRERHWLYGLHRLFFHRHPPVKGLYVWGGVGMGKTYLMDSFYQSLPFKDKQRLHFHHFMQNIHAELQTLQGKADPLPIIAKRLSKTIRVLCFDEFFVKDIADAMLLGGIFTALFKHGVTLVATSNVAPQQLYANGLQRSRFLPAIALLEQHTQVLHIEALQDYRLRHLTQFGGYICPLGAKAESELAHWFTALTRQSHWQAGQLVVSHREIPYRAMSADTIWFDFDVICHTPRSQLDYLEIAHQFQNVIVSNVPVILSTQDDRITYLINLVDVFYDNHVKLILSAAAPVEALYPAGRLVFEFSRTRSRLQEMQSQAYWHQERGIQWS